MRLSYAPRGGWLQPIVPVVLCAGRTQLEYEAVADSGAESTIFDSSVAHLLGLQLDGSPQQLETVSGHRIDVRYRAVRMQIGEKQWIANIGFADLHDKQLGLLGHLGFFDHFRVAFNYRAGEFSLEPYVRA